MRLSLAPPDKQSLEFRLCSERRSDPPRSLALPPLALHETGCNLGYALALKESRIDRGFVGGERLSLKQFHPKQYSTKLETVKAGAGNAAARARSIIH